MQDKTDLNEPRPPASESRINAGRDTVSDEEIDLMEILRKHVFPYWKKYCAAAFVGAVLLAAFSYSRMPQYNAEAVSIVNISSASSLLKGSLGSLASLAGVNVSSGDSNAMFNISYINSRELADAFIAKYDLRHELFYKSYDENGAYKQADRLDRLYVKLLGKGYADARDDDVYLAPGPSKEELYKKFQRVFHVNVDQKKMTVLVSVTWKDPIKAKQWANDYIRLANDILKRKAIGESTLKIHYLETQARENTEVEVQQAIYSLIETEMKQIAVAESSDQYAFKVTQRAFLPERRVSPNRYAYLFSGMILGCVGMFGFILFRNLKK